MWIWIAAGVVGIIILSKRAVDTGSILTDGQAQMVVMALASQRKVSVSTLKYTIAGNRIVVTDLSGWQYVDAIGYDAAMAQISKY